MSRPGREQQDLAWARPTEGGGSRSLAADRGAIRIQMGLKPQLKCVSKSERKRTSNNFRARAHKAARRRAVTAWPLILIGCASCRSGGVVLVLVLVMGLGLGQGPGLGLPSAGSIALRDVPTRTHAEVKEDSATRAERHANPGREKARGEKRVGGRGSARGRARRVPQRARPAEGGTRRPRGVSRWPPAADRRCWLVVAWG